MNLIIFTEETLHDIPDRPPRHQSYLLRCWEVRSQQPDQGSVWRFSLQDPRTGEVRKFPDFESLAIYLQTELLD